MENCIWEEVVLSRWHEVSAAVLNARGGCVGMNESASQALCGQVH